jgi:hypothetical protein
LLGGQFKGIYQNCGQLGHKLFQCKNRAINNGRNNGNSGGGIFCSYCRKTGHDKKNCFKLKKEARKNNTPNSSNSSGNRQTMSHKLLCSKNGTLRNDIGFVKFAPLIQSLSVQIRP